MLMGCRESCKLGPRRSQHNNRRRFVFSHSVRIYAIIGDSFSAIQ